MGMNIPLSFGASGKPVKPGMRASVYYPPIIAAPGSGTTTAVADAIYYAPFYLPGDTVNRIAVEVTASAAGNVRLGIYSNDPALGGPATLLVDAGAVSAGSIAICEATFSDLVLPNDLVWAAAIFSGTPTIRTFTGENTYLIGMSTTSLSSGGARGLVKTSTPYGALPVSAPTPAANPSFSGAPMIALRKV